MTLRSFLDSKSSRTQFALTGNAIGEATGDAMTRTLLPIIAITTVGVDAGTIGVVNALGFLAFLTLGPIAGVLVDRATDPSRFMSAATVVRILALLIALATWGADLLQGALGVTVVVFIAAITGVADVLYTSGQGKLIARITPPEQLQNCYGRIITWGQSGTFIGPVLVTAMVGVVAEPLAMVLPVAAYAVALGASPILRRANAASPPPQLPDLESPKTPMRQHIRAGFATIKSHPILRAVTTANALINCAVMVGNTVIPVFVLQTLGAPAAYYALISVVGATAGIVGASVGAPITKKWGLVRARVASSVLMCTGVLALIGAHGLLGFLPGSTLIWVAFNSAAGAIGISVIMVAGAHLPARCVPHEELGAVQAAARTLVLGAMPIVSIAAGAATLAVGPLPVICSWLLIHLLAIGPNVQLTNADRFFLPDPATAQN